MQSLFQVLNVIIKSYLIFIAEYFNITEYVRQHPITAWKRRKPIFLHVFTIKTARLLQVHVRIIYWD